MCYFVLQDALNIIDIGIDPVTDESTNTTVRRIQSKIFLLSILYHYARLMKFSIIPSLFQPYPELTVILEQVNHL